MEEKLGFTRGRRAACAKAQRCGKAEFGVWWSRVRRDLKAVVGGSQLKACTQEIWVGVGHGCGTPTMDGTGMIQRNQGQGGEGVGAACSRSAQWL